MQSSFHRIARVLRNRPYNAFRPYPLYRHAAFPIGFHRKVGRLTQELTPSSSRFSRVSYAASRGARSILSLTTVALLEFCC